MLTNAHTFRDTVSEFLKMDYSPEIYIEFYYNIFLINKIEVFDGGEQNIVNNTLRG